MALHFQSLRSGSSGNCLMLWTEGTRVLIDCGVPAQFRCRELLDEHAGGASNIDAVIVSHAHTDHIRYESLKVFEQAAVPVYCHEDCLPQIFDKHHAARCGGAVFRTFTAGRFRVKDLEFEPVRVSHHPLFPTHGFIVRSRQNGKDRKIVVVTDFNNGAGLEELFADADFIFVEANYDPDLLRKYFNPNSLFHMENSKTGRLLSLTLARSRTLPAAIMLGHLSEERNSSRLALSAVQRILDEQKIPKDFPLSAAPRYSASETIRIA